jgi:hypothetical protein
MNTKESAECAQGEAMKSKGRLQISLGSVLLFGTLFVLPSSAYGVLSGTASEGSLALFVVGLVLLAGGSGLLGIGLVRQSRNLRTARTYDSREPSIPGPERPENAYAPPPAFSQYQAGAGPSA